MSDSRRIGSVLVIGSGPVSIGQAAEFDYAGSQACLAFRDEGIKVVLLNSNPATIQTDYSIADRIYIEPITVDSVLSIIEKEHIDGIFAAVGGQTALNLLISLNNEGILERYNLEVLGTPVENVELAENRQKFHEFMQEINQPVAESWTFTKGNYETIIASIGEMEYIVRTSFSLGGSGGNIIPDRKSLLSFCREFFSIRPEEDLNVEQSLLGLTELEYEMMRDKAGNCISICNMENIDPMGVHTGESIVVTPSMTLTDKEYHLLRTAAIDVIGSLNIIGACNIQFALNRDNGDYYIVEVNPRTSRSSALASKSSGYPIARISTKLSLGYLLHEVRNPITVDSFAGSEPSLDYVTVKIPRWPFDKFPVSRDLGVQMKSIGEVMGIGRTFEEALMKAIASLDTRDATNIRLFVTDEKLRELLEKPNDRRIFSIFEALFRNWDIEKICSISSYLPFFVERIAKVVSLLKTIGINEIPANLNSIKEMGISDETIASFSRMNARRITEHRIWNGIVPSYRSIDTCSGEFEAVTPYLYSTYGENSDVWKDNGKEKIIILGSGPNRISQGLEFDYGAVKASTRIRELGYEAIMINSNPETVSTDFDISDRLFFEPVTLEHVANIIHTERPKGIIIQFSGQTGQNMALDIREMFGDSIFLGTLPENIFRIEDRGKFASALKKMGIRQPEFHEVYSENDTDLILNRLSTPLIVRSSFIIGGRAMEVIHNRESAIEMVRQALQERPGFPVLISKYIENATEIDVDFISDGKNASICGISVHVEEAGTHSGDATMVFGPDDPSQETVERLKKMVNDLCDEFHLTGLSNLQVMYRNGEIFVIELNSRASRTVPFISKAAGIDYVSRAIDAMLGLYNPGNDQYNPPLSYAVKVPVFPFRKFPELDIFLSLEMKSTGEGMALGRTLEEAMNKAMLLYHSNAVDTQKVILTLGEDDKSSALGVINMLNEQKSRLFCTPGTAAFLKSKGIECETVYKLEDVRSPKIDEIIRNGSISLIVNTPGSNGRYQRDGFEIRKLALSKNIPVITNLRMAQTAISIAGKTVKFDARELAEYCKP